MLLMALDFHCDLEIRYIFREILSYSLRWHLVENAFKVMRHKIRSLRSSPIFFAQ